MPESAGFAIHESDIDDLLSMLRAYRRGEFTRREPRRLEPPHVPNGNRLCVLLDYLHAEECTIAEQLRRWPVTDAHTEVTPEIRVLDVRVSGTPTPADPGDLSLTWSGKPEVVFSAHATAAEVYKIAHDLLGDDLLEVSLGSHNYEGTDFHPMRWRFVVKGDLRSTAPEVDEAGLNGIANIDTTWSLPYVGTGHLFKVWSIIPERAFREYGSGTQLVAGTQCGCRLFHGIGWCVTDPEWRPLQRIRFEFDDYEDEANLVANVTVKSDTHGTHLGESVEVTDASGNFFGDEDEADLEGRSGWATLVEYEEIATDSRGFRFEVDSLDCPPP